MIPVIIAPIEGQVKFDSDRNVFSWTAVTGADKYWIDVGTYDGGNSYYDSGDINGITRLITGLPANTTLFVTVWGKVTGVYYKGVAVSFTSMGATPDKLSKRVNIIKKNTRSRRQAMR